MAVMELWRRRDLEGTVKTEYVDGNFFTQDSAGNLVGVKCYKDGAEATLSGSVTGYCILTNGETVSVAGTRNGNQASILIPQSALAYPGPLGVVIKLVDGNTITTLISVIVVVYRSKTDTVITPSSQIITDWSNQIAAALQDVEDASAAQDAKIDDLKSALFTFTGNKRIEMVTGAYYPLNGTSINIGSPTAYGTEKYALVPCSPGDIFTVSGTGGGSARPWGFVKQNGDIIKTSGNTSTVTIENAIIVAPEESAYLVLNNQTSSNAVSYVGKFLADTVDEIKSALGYTNDSESNKFGLVQYFDSDTFIQKEKVAGATDSSILGFTHFGTICTLDGGGSSKVIFIKLNGSTLNRTNASANVDTWPEPIELKTGRTYVATLNHLSGEQSTRPYISVYRTGEHATIGEAVVETDSEYSREFVYTGVPVHIVLYVPASATFVNAKYDVTLKEKSIDVFQASNTPFYETYGYSTGDIVANAGTIYAFKQSHIGSWDATHVVAIRNAETTGGTDIVKGGVLQGYPSGGAIVSDNSTRIVWARVFPGCTYVIRRAIKSSRFRVLYTIDRPEIGASTLTGYNINMDTAPNVIVTAPAEAVYMLVYCASSVDSNRDAITNGISIVAKTDGDATAMEALENGGVVLDKDFNEKAASAINRLVKDVNDYDLWVQGGIGSNGENYNSRNTSIRTQLFLPLDDYVSITTTSEFTTGYLVLYSENTRSGFIVRRALESETTLGINTIKERRPTAKYFRIEIGGVSGDPINYNRVELIGLSVAQSSQVAKTIINLNENNKAKARVLKIQRITSEQWGNAALRFLFITDVHAEAVRMRRCIQLANEWDTDFIQVIVNGGDTVRTKLTDGIAWYDSLVQSSELPILNTVGNHDAYYDTNGVVTDRKTVYDAIIAPVKVNVPEIVQPENAETLGLNYYYYDVGDIRIIVIDCMFWDAAQRTWFATTLESARTNSMPVVCVSHYNFNANYVDPVECLWTPKTHAVGGGSMSMNNEPAIEVHTFQNNGGIFVAWLTGHSHGDIIKKLKPEYGTQYLFTFPSFANRASSVHKSDQETEYNYDCLTYLAVDTNLGVLKGLRIGANINNEGTEHNGFVLDYVNGNLVSTY